MIDKTDTLQKLYEMKAQCGDSKIRLGIQRAIDLIENIEEN